MLWDVKVDREEFTPMVVTIKINNRGELHQLSRFLQKRELIEGHFSNSISDLGRYLLRVHQGEEEL